MKKKLFIIMLILSFALSSLASCMLMPELDEGDGGKDNDGVSDTIINVEGGPNYGDINITAASNQNLLAASKAMLSAVSIQCRFEVKKYNFYGSYVGTEVTGSAGSGVIYKLDKTHGDAYVITNYPEYEGKVFANVFIYRGRVIGGDICTEAKDGFIHGFSKNTHL